MARSLMAVMQSKDNEKQQPIRANNGPIEVESPQDKRSENDEAREPATSTTIFDDIDSTWDREITLSERVQRTIKQSFANGTFFNQYLAKNRNFNDPATLDMLATHLGLRDQYVTRTTWPFPEKGNRDLIRKLYRA